MTPESLVTRFETPHRIVLGFADVPIGVKTNDPEIRARLASYFRPYVASGSSRPLAEVALIQGTLPLSGEFVDVQRDRGRRAKEATQEVAGGRLVIKRATRVLIGLWTGGGAFAVGDLRTHLNQGINLVNGPGTVELRGRMKALVLLKWRRDGQGLDVRHLSVDEALAALPLVYKNLGAFDLDRVPGSGITDAERACYRELFGRVTVAEITGRVDFSGLVPVVDQLLSR